MPLNRAVGWLSISVVSWMRKRCEDSGGDPSLIPDELAEFWRLQKVMQRTGLARATIYRLGAEGQFPKPVKLSLPPPEAA